MRAGVKARPEALAHLFVRETLDQMLVVFQERDLQPEALRRHERLLMERVRRGRVLERDWLRRTRNELLLLLLHGRAGTHVFAERVGFPSLSTSSQELAECARACCRRVRSIHPKM